MDINIRRFKLLPPKNIKIIYANLKNDANITWDKITYNNYKIGYNIYRSTIANGIFYKLNKDVILTNRYEDKTIIANMNTMYWYKISTLYLNENNDWIESKLSNAHIYKVDNTNKWFHKINERNMWILKMDGELFDLYKRKTEGIHCDCWDEIRGSSSNPNCTKCYGTGFIGGYDPIYQIFVRQKPANNSLDRTQRGLSVKNSTGAWTICDVQIRDRDILINPHGQMFRVVNTNINHSAGYYFHQEIVMEEVETNDPIYNLKRITLYPNI